MRAISLGMPLAACFTWATTRVASRRKPVSLDCALPRPSLWCYASSPSDGPSRASVLQPSVVTFALPIPTGRAARFLGAVINIPHTLCNVNRYEREFARILHPERHARASGKTPVDSRRDQEKGATHSIAPRMLPPVRRGRPCGRSRRCRLSPRQVGKVSQASCASRRVTGKGTQHPPRRGHRESARGSPAVDP